MKAILKGLASLLGGLLLACLALAFLALEGTPLVSRDETISPATIALARALFHAHDPRHLAAGEAREINLPISLLDAGVNYLSSRTLHGRGQLQLTGERAELRLTVPVPGLGDCCFLNLRSHIGVSGSEPRLTQASLGALPLPPFLLEAAMRHAVRRAGYAPDWQLAQRAMRRLVFDATAQTVLIGYVWEPALLDNARATAISAADTDHLRRAQERLAALLDGQAPGSQVALVDLLNPLLRAGDTTFAQQRASLLVVAAYLAQKNLASLIPAAAGWPPARPVVLTLLGRDDSAQHFVISAALAAWAGEPLADAVGLYKELADARHGSGFSFADLAADRAGSRFGKQLRERPSQMQARLAARDFTDGDLAPPLTDLPEQLADEEFRRRFSEPGSPAYLQIAGEIERRLDRLPFYQ